MCLAIPGRVLEVEGDGEFERFGRVDFGGPIKRIDLTFVPEATVGQYVLVHVGVAIQVIDEREAALVFEYLDEIGELELGEEAGEGRGTA